MVFSTNQNRQLYVVSSVVDTEPANLGEIQVGVTPDKRKFWLKYFGHGGLIRTDLIDTESVIYARETKAAELRRALKGAKISLDPNVNGGLPIAGQDYIVRVIVRNYLAPGDAHTAIKHGAVHAYAGMDAATFYTKLAESLTMNFSREACPMLTFEAAADGVSFTEVEQPWVMGTYSQEAVNFEIYTVPVRYQGDEVLWAVRDAKDMISVTPGNDYVGNGKLIADLEYFCMGERGDQYRNQGWPNVIPTKYMVDPDKEYDVLDMHYFFSDTGVNVQKSEKDITFVAESSTDLKSKLENEVGIKFQTKKAKASFKKPVKGEEC